MPQQISALRPDQITGVILAGGKARRMGGIDKGLVDFAGRPLVSRVAEALRPQVGRLVINANRNHDTYGSLGFEIVPDTLADYQGPLAGFAAAMAAASTPWILTVPCDGPFVAPDLAARLAGALTQSCADAPAELAVADDGERLQPVYALLAVDLAGSLSRFLAEGERKIDRWYARHRYAVADMSDCPRCFTNINTLEDSAALAEEMRP